LSYPECRVARMFDLAEFAAVDPLADEAALIARIDELERLKSAAAAGQARASAALDDKRRAVEAAAGVPKAKQGRGLASEIGLARRDSPDRGARQLNMAKTLVHDMPHTLAALECGALSEYRAGLIAAEAADLSRADRRILDAEMCADASTLEGMGNGRITAEAKAIAHRLDDRAASERAAKAAKDRRVTIRPAPNALSYLTVLLPAAQGAAVFEELNRTAGSALAAGDNRTRGAVMADTLFERVIGRPAWVAEPVAVNLVLSDETLFGGDDSPAVLEGFGPIPAGVARNLVADAVSDEQSKATLRRLYKHPKTGALVGMESRSRRFPKSLAKFIRLRDQRCRTPYCDAPIRHLDHAQPRNRGGPTSARNGRGACERCNYVKESPGWHVATGEVNGVHTTEFVTPTGVRYRSTAPPAPGRPVIDISEVEMRIGIAIARHAA
jgi:HNH endonuclease